MIDGSLEAADAVAKAKPDVFGLFGDGDAAIAATDDALVSFEVEQDTYTAAEPRTGGTGRYQL